MNRYRWPEAEALLLILAAVDGVLGLVYLAMGLG